PARRHTGVGAVRELLASRSPDGRFTNRPYRAGRARPLSPAAAGAAVPGQALPEPGPRPHVERPAGHALHHLADRVFDGGGGGLLFLEASLEGGASLADLAEDLDLVHAGAVAVLDHHLAVDEHQIDVGPVLAVDELHGQ